MARVLVVDDERGIRESLSEFLRLEGHEVFVAEDLAEGQYIAFNHDLDVIVTDIILPQGNGLDLLKAVHDTRPEVQVIMSSGEPTIKATVQAMRLGAFDFLAKPVSGNEVCRVVAKAAEKKALQDRTVENLRRSEEKYRLLAENAADVVFTMDLRKRITYISPSVTQLLGYTVGEVFALTLKDCLTPTSFAFASRVFENEFKDKLEKGEDVYLSQTLELEQLCKDGSRVWTEVRVNTFRDFEGRLIGIQGVARDISERKKAAEMKRRYLRYLEMLSSASMDIINISSEAELYPFIAERVHELAAGAVAIVSSYTEKSEYSVVKAVAGIEALKEEMHQLFDRDILEMNFPVSPDNLLVTGRLEKESGGLHVVTEGLVDREQSRAFAEKTGIRGIYSMGFTRKQKVFGSVVIISLKHTEEFFTDIIEAFINQATVALQRIFTERLLTESEARYLSRPENK